MSKFKVKTSLATKKFIHIKIVAAANDLNNIGGAF
jgi:hypothetical protein